MNTENSSDESKKLAVVVDGELPVGLAANAASIATMAMVPKADLLGPDVIDSDGVQHAGITRFSVVVLKGAPPALKKLYTDGRSRPGTVVTAMTHIGLSHNDNYDGYAKALSAAGREQLKYAAVAVFGPTKTVRKLTGSLGLLR